MTKKTITLTFDEETYKDIRRAAMARAFNAYGLLDAFIIKLVQTIDKGESEWEVKKKSESN